MCLPESVRYIQHFSLAHLSRERKRYLDRFQIISRVVSKSHTDRQTDRLRYSVVHNRRNLPTY